MKQQPSMVGRRFGTVTLVVAVITACANGDATVDDDGGLDGGKKDANQVVDTGAKDTAMSMCSSCNIDLDCQNTCGTPPDQMVWCCDVGMNSCYPAQFCIDQDSGTGD